MLVTSDFPCNLSPPPPPSTSNTPTTITPLYADKLRHPALFYRRTYDLQYDTVIRLQQPSSTYLYFRRQSGLSTCVLLVISLYHTFFPLLLRILNHWSCSLFSTTGESGGGEGGGGGGLFTVASGSPHEDWTERRTGSGGRRIQAVNIKPAECTYYPCRLWWRWAFNVEFDVYNNN